MTETALLPAPRSVDYVDPDVLAALPASFPCAWVAEESCRRVSDAAADLPPAEREALLVRATSFAEDVLGVLKIDVLPEALEECIFLDPYGRLQLIGARSRNKIRVDEDFRIVYLRERPAIPAGPRAATLRQEARELLCFPLASADRKPVMAIQALDLSSLAEPGTLYLELDAPTGTAYRGGRSDRLRIFGDGKVLILCFRPLPDVDAEGYQVGSPDADLAKLPGSAGRRLEEIEAASDGGLNARLKAKALAAAAKNATDEANAGLDAEGEPGEGAGQGASGAADGGDAGTAAARKAASRGVPSESPFEQPGWAADVAPILS